MTALSEIEQRLAADALQSGYIACIDDDRLEEWPDFFTDDCHYRITHKSDFGAGRRHGIIYATNRDMLCDRVRSLREANIYEPQHYRHIINPARITQAEYQTLTVTTGFAVYRTTQAGETHAFMTGEYRDVMVWTGAGWRFREKVAIADSRAVDTLLAIPI